MKWEVLAGGGRMSKRIKEGRGRGCGSHDRTRRGSDKNRSVFGKEENLALVIPCMYKLILIDFI